MSGQAAPSCDVGIPRRRFLSKLGAAGLAASTGFFASESTSAAAGGCQCCNLVYCPPNTTFGTCMAYHHYLWGCTTSGGFLWCQCCERFGPGGGYIQSAYQCQYP